MKLEKSNDNAISTNAELIDFYINLGSLYEQKSRWPSALAHYRLALRINPNLAIGYKKLADLWYKLNRINKAAESWDKAFSLDPQLIEESPEFIDFINQLKSQVRSQKAIATYEHLLKVNPNCLQVYRSLREVHGTELDALLERAETLAESENLQEAIATYCQALDTNNLISNEIAINFYEKLLKKPDILTNTYLTLGIALARNGMINKIISSYQEVIETESYRNQLYHDLAIAISQQGLIDQAVACFSAAGKQKTEPEIYETIWKSLNALSSFDENDPLYQIEIQPEVAEAYFSQTSQYRVIKIWELTQEDNNFLLSSGLSIEYLQLMGQSSAALEQIYINSFNCEQPINFSEEEPSIATNREHIDRYFQQTIAETGYLYVICPTSGRVLRSNQSFSLQCRRSGSCPQNRREQRNIYRFVGEQVFYIMCSPFFWQKNFLYFPKLEAIIILRHSAIMNTFDYLIFNTFKAYAVSFWKDFESYLLSESSRKTAVIFGVFSNISHNLWIDFGGLNYLQQTKRLHKIDTFLAGTWDYFKIELLFPEISSDKIVNFSSAKDSDNYDLFKFLLKGNYFCFTPSDFILTEDFVQNRIYPAGRKKCSQDFLQQLEKAKSHFPLILFQVRTNQRSWLSQIQGTANLIKQFYLDYPDLAVLFDGWSTVEGVEDPNEQRQIEKDQEVVKNICSLLPSEIPIYSTVGSSVYETILFATAIDFYIAPTASGTLFPMIANKPGVQFMNRAFHETGVIKQLQDRENFIMPTLVPIENIFNETSPGSWDSDFDYDWRVIYDIALKLVQSLADAKDKNRLFS